MALVAVVLGCAYWMWPLADAASLARAARENAAGEVIDRVDIPALRRSLARQIATAYLDASGKGGKLGTLGRGLAGAAATTVADPYVAELLTPANIVALLSEGKVNQVALNGHTLAVKETLPGLTDLSASDALARVTGSYFEGPTHFVVPVNPNAGPADAVRVHLNLGGLRWRLSGIDLPPALVGAMARAVLASGEASTP